MMLRQALIVLAFRPWWRSCGSARTERMGSSVKYLFAPFRQAIRRATRHCRLLVSISTLYLYSQSFEKRQNKIRYFAEALQIHHFATRHMCDLAPPSRWRVFFGRLINPESDDGR